MKNKKSFSTCHGSPGASMTLSHLASNKVSSKTGGNIELKNDTQKS